MSSETWNSIQEHKRKQESLRERIQKRRRERQGVPSTNIGENVKSANIAVKTSEESAISRNESYSVLTSVDPKVEKCLQEFLCSSALAFPMNSKAVLNGLKQFPKLGPKKAEKVTIAEVELVLQKQAAQKFLTLSNSSDSERDGCDGFIEVTSIELDKLAAVVGEFQPAGLQQKNDVDKKQEEIKTSKSRTEKSHKRHVSGRNHDKHSFKRNKIKKTEKSKKPVDDIDDIQALLSTKTAKEQDTTRVADEIQELLSVASTKEQTLAEKFRSLGGSQVREFCPHATREECLRHNKSYSSCQKLHFRKILKPHTDESLGDCSFLNTCFHMDTCKYVHYEIDYRGTDLDPRKSRKGDKARDVSSDEKSLLPKFASDDDYINRKMLPPQWITCDIRYIDFSILGKFSVIMADPPWDIHMELPYGTMQDDEMRALRVQDLSDDGLMFLWVTGRAMELGRELFDLWGYKRCDELIWVKTNQLQRLIRTGRTGHWINHGKEHCLVGIKGNPKAINRRLDCDVLVAEVRATSHKPDEVYGIIERLSPGTRKLELFGRMHNVQPNWITLGNQLDGVHLTEYDVVEKFEAKYPDGKVTKPKIALLETPKQVEPY